MINAVETAISNSISSAHLMLMQNCSDLVICLDEALNIVALNPAAETVFRWKRAHVQHANFIDLCFSHNFSHPLPQGLQHNISGAFDSLHDIEILHPNGQSFWVSWSIHPLSLENSDQLGLMLIGRDKTDVHLEKQQHQQLRQIFDQLPAMVYLKDTNFAYQTGNDTLLKSVSMHTERHLIGKTDFDLPWANQADSHRAHDQNVLSGKSEDISYEHTYQVNGELKNCLSYKKRLTDAHGKTLGILGVSVDHTQTKATELALRKQLDAAQKTGKLGVDFIHKMSKEVIGKSFNDPEYANNLTDSIHLFLDTIIARMPNFVHWKDTKSNYLGCNNAMAKAAGLSNRTEIAGMTDKELGLRLGTDQSILDHIVLTDQQVIYSGQAHSFETQFVTADGSILTLNAVKTPIRDASGKVVGIFTVSTDITERKAIEKSLHQEKQRAELASESKSNFLATMSHELRTPLNAIMGITQILLSRAHAPDQRDYLQIVWQSSHSLLSLINDILDYSKIEAGKLEVFSSPVNLHDIVQEVFADLTPNAENKSINLQLHYDAVAKQKVLGDTGCIRQILTNLVDNGIKFTHSGGVDVHIMAIEQDGEIPENVKVCVQDTGIGIPQDKLLSIFDRFTQVNSSISGHFDGTGLGLAICKQLASAMGGEIQVESTLNKGSRFWFTLPFVPPEGLSAAQTGDVVAIQAGAESEDRYQSAPQEEVDVDYRVLLVEDNPLNQKIVTTMLHDLDYTVDIASNGRQAITLFQTQPYHLLFMDIGLPDMDGLEVTQAIRRIEGADSHVPIIALTAHMMEDDLIKCLQAGADDALTKPLMLDALLRILKKWVLKKPERMRNYASSKQSNFPAS